MKSKHLTISDRIEIESGLKQDKTLTQIATALDKSVSAIRQEIKIHRTKKYPSTFNGKRNLCKYYKDESCTINGLCNIDSCSSLCKKCKRHFCNDICHNYEEYQCDRISKKPYCCNGCSNKNCFNVKAVYYASIAEKEYQDSLKNSRSGPRITSEEINYINTNVKPRIENGQSFSNIKMSDNNIDMSIASLYNYTNQCLFDFRNIDLPKKVQYRSRKKNKNENNDEQRQTIITKLKLTRNYQCFLEYTKKNPTFNIAEMDTVEGCKGGKLLLTLLFRKSNFMIAILIKDKKAYTVLKKLDYLKDKITSDVFFLLFRILLTDNGVEFTLIEDIEKLENNDNINLFFCDSGKSNQKGKIEKNHVEIRKVLPKGTSFDNLTQKDINLMMSHINSYKRKKLDNISPYEALVKEFGENFTNELMKQLNYKVINDKDIILKPKLLKKDL